jgi:hypothetical protein
MVEQGTHKPLVVGSNPSLATQARALAVHLLLRGFLLTKG